MKNPSFRHLAPPSRVFFGDGCLAQLPAELARVGARRAVVFCGRTLADASPGLGSVRDALGSAFAGVFAGVVEQSPLAVVEAAVDELRRLGADAVVALGGGSAVVTARAATVLHGEGKGAHELSTKFTPGQPPASPKLVQPKLPQFVVPTTPTTAFAKTGAAVALPGVGLRLSLFDPKARAQTIFLEPKLFEAAPDRLVLDASIDSFAQAIQGLESTRREPLADALLLHGVRLIWRALAGSDKTQQVSHRGDLMLAAQLIGEGTDYTGAGVTSAIGHAIGARFGVPNGVVKAIVLPLTLAFNAPVTRGRMGEVAEALGLRGTGENVPAVVGETCREFFDRLGLPGTLRQLNVPYDALPQVVDDVSQDWFFTQNPRTMPQDDLQHLLEGAW